MVVMEASCKAAWEYMGGCLCQGRVWHAPFTFIVEGLSQRSLLQAPVDT